MLDRCAPGASPPARNELLRSIGTVFDVMSRFATPLLFAVTMFLGAALLFWVQPMFARMVLPLLGGTPAVWNTCVVFFQAVLLAGYGYSHLLPPYLGVRRQALVHLLVLLLPLLVLPIAVPKGLVDALDYTHPGLGLLGLLLLGVGLPFLVVSTTAPLVQRWFAETGHLRAHDPYFLYAASNLGSMIGLLSYPFLLEPLLPLDEQSRLWMYGYLALALGMTACALLLFQGDAPPREQGPGETNPAKKPATPLVTVAPTTAVRLRWLALSFVPSSLMLSVTTYLTTDVAPVPLLWVIPLALYLLTFIVAFGRTSWLPRWGLNRVLPFFMLLAFVVLLSEATAIKNIPDWVLMAIHLLLLFVVALFCHGELAHRRPAPRYLTEFYLWLSVGGVLGGLFNALVAPLLFWGITEYPLVLLLACLLRFPTVEAAPVKGRAPVIPKFRFAVLGRRVEVERADVLLPLAVGVLTVILVLLGRSLGVEAGPVSVAAMFSVPLVIAYTFQDRPLRFALGLAGVLLASSLYPGIHGQVEYQGRNFYGVHKVVLITDEDGKPVYRRLIHGNTIHGQQALPIESSDRPQASAYFHPTAPIGQVFALLDRAQRTPKDVGVVGLGAGSLAAYGREGQHWTFYEIDPLVIYLASPEAGYFTFLKRCAAQWRVVEGDARLELARTNEAYDVLVIDAFCSDALPVHLFTREALRKVYLERLRSKGLVAFHISNRYLDMKPVLAELARDAGLTCVAQKSTEDKKTGRFPSEWVVMGRREAGLEELAPRATWERLPGGEGQPLWTDDYSNLLRLLFH